MEMYGIKSGWNKECALATREALGDRDAARELKALAPKKLVRRP
jgi:hypothetical protein